MRTLVSMPSWLMGTLFVGAAVLVAIVLTHVVRRHVPHAVLKENTEFVGFAYAVLGLLYGVILGFTVIVAWEQFSQADRSATDEVTYLSELWRDSQMLPAATRRQIEDRIVSYTRSVITQEWHTMARSGKPNPATERRYRAIWDTFYAFHPQTAQQIAFYNRGLSELNEFGRERRLRLLASRTVVPVIMWVFLIAGGVMTVAFLYVFAPKYVASHAFVAASLAGIISFSLFLVMSLQFPFTGDVSVKPDAFRELLVSLKERELASPMPSTAPAPPSGNAQMSERKDEAAR